MALTFTDQNKKTVLRAEGRFQAVVSVAVKAGDLLSFLNTGTTNVVQLADQSTSVPAQAVAIDDGLAGDLIWCAETVELEAPTTFGTGGIITQTNFAAAADFLGSPLYLGESGKAAASAGSTYGQIVGRVLNRDRILLSVKPDLHTLLDGVALVFGDGPDAKVLYDGTNDEWTVQTDDTGGNFTDRLKVLANVDITTVELFNDDAGATGIRLDMYHNSASPATSDVIGHIRVFGMDGNATSAKAQYGGLKWSITNVTDTTEEGQMIIELHVAGALATVATITGPDMFWANDGGVVIGHTAQVSPNSNAHEFQVLGTGFNDSSMLLGRWSADSGTPGIRFLKSRDPVIADGTFAIVEDNDVIGQIDWFADDGTDLDTQVARFLAEVDDASPGTGDIGMAFAWEQMAAGVAKRETMRLTASGHLHMANGGGIVVGHTAQVTVDSSTFELQVLGTSFADSSMLLARFSGDANPPSIRFLKSKETTIAPGTFAKVVDNDVIAQFDFFADDGVDLDTKVARYLLEVDDADTGAGDIGTAFAWETMAAGMALRETMRLTAAGVLNLSGNNLLLTASVDSAAVADQVSIGRYEIGSSNTVLAISQETAVAAEADETKFSHKVQMRINGATYFVMLTDS